MRSGARAGYCARHGNGGAAVAEGQGELSETSTELQPRIENPQQRAARTITAMSILPFLTQHRKHQAAGWAAERTGRPAVRGGPHPKGRNESGGPAQPVAARRGGAKGSDRPHRWPKATTSSRQRRDGRMAGQRPAGAAATWLRARARPCLQQGGSILEGYSMACCPSGT